LAEQTQLSSDVPFFGFEFVHEILISITTERIPEAGGGALCFLVSCFELCFLAIVFRTLSENPGIIDHPQAAIRLFLVI
jgi:hypothetical protein